MRWLSMSVTLRWMASETRKPAAVGRHENRSMLEAVDRIEEMHDFLAAENHRQLEGPLGHWNLINGPVTFEGDFVQKAQCAGGDTDTARRKPSGIHQIELIGANRFRTEFFWRAVKMFCIGDNLLQVGRLGIIGEVAELPCLRPSADVNESWQIS